MKRVAIILLLTIAFVALSLSSCNYNPMEMKYHYDYAIIKLPNGEVIEGKVVQWTDYEGEQLQLVLEDGNTYLVSSFYTTLICYGNKDDIPSH